MPDTMGEYVMALNEKLQDLAAFEDAADIGATAQHFGRGEEGHSLQMRFAKEVLSVSYHKMVQFWPWAILERSCHLQLQMIFSQVRYRDSTSHVP